MNRDYLDKHYWKDKESTLQIAKQLNIHPNTVRRAIIKFWGKLRTKSEAQNIVIKKSGHQRIGKKHNQDSKDKISNTLKRKEDHGSQEE